MSEDIIEDKEGMKIRKLVELRTSTAKEYEDVMISRVEEFKNKNAEKSVYNNFIQNTIVSGIGSLLDLKLQIEKSLGEENVKKINETIDKLLLIGL
ncbi:MAG: hypothetical protein ACW98D_08090 [Promethearchaeota archaeon]|jgi:hypothetical protein